MDYKILKNEIDKFRNGTLSKFSNEEKKTYIKNIKILYLKILTKGTKVTIRFRKNKYEAVLLYDVKEGDINIKILKENVEKKIDMINIMYIEGENELYNEENNGEDSEENNEEDSETIVDESGNISDYSMGEMFSEESEENCDNIEIEISGIRNVTTYPAYRKTCEAILLPLISAIAELIGYEEEIKDIIKAGEMEGKIQKITIIKRERSKRNRLLCLRAHGDKCKICKFIPKLKYGEIGSIIEVHHIQPLSLNSEVRSYDPTNDLIPLCPNCHRAIHKKRPTPYSPQELIEIMTNAE